MKRTLLLVICTGTVSASDPTPFIHFIIGIPHIAIGAIAVLAGMGVLLVGSPAIGNTFLAVMGSVAIAQVCGAIWLYAKLGSPEYRDYWGLLFTEIASAIACCAVMVTALAMRLSRRSSQGESGSDINGKVQ